MLQQVKYIIDHTHAPLLICSTIIHVPLPCALSLFRALSIHEACTPGTDSEKYQSPGCPAGLGYKSVRPNSEMPQKQRHGAMFLGVPLVSPLSLNSLGHSWGSPGELSSIYAWLCPPMPSQPLGVISADGRCPLAQG